MKCLSKVALSSRRLFRLSELSIRMTYAHRSRVSILPAYVARFAVICATIRGPVCRKNILIAFKTFDEYIFHVDFFLLYLLFLPCFVELENRTSQFLTSHFKLE